MLAPFFVFIQFLFYTNVQAHLPIFGKFIQIPPNGKLQQGRNLTAPSPTATAWRPGAARNILLNLIHPWEITKPAIDTPTLNTRGRLAYSLLAERKTQSPPLAPPTPPVPPKLPTPPTPPTPLSSTTQQQGKTGRTSWVDRITLPFLRNRPPQPPSAPANGIGDTLEIINGSQMLPIPGFTGLIGIAQTFFTRFGPLTSADLDKPQELTEIRALADEVAQPSQTGRTKTGCKCQKNQICGLEVEYQEETTEIPIS